MNIMEHSTFDILGMKNVVDNNRWHFDYSGQFRISNATLYLESSNYGTEMGCSIVDFVPNLFLGRTKQVTSVGWDSRFKVGEHEDFFLRAKYRKLKVGTCPAVWVWHKQEIRKRKTLYDFNRQRVNVRIIW
jgi:hypothetical protein